MMAAVANGGKLYKPHFLDYARGAGSEVAQRYEPQFVQVGVSQSALDMLREGLRRVVDSGTARDSGLAKFRAAGKTGTAEVGLPGLCHAWFAGYAPYDSPKIAFAIVSELTTGHGGTNAAPIMTWALEPVWDAVQQMP
jgi:penicillin-binding protein 2